MPRDEVVVPHRCFALNSQLPTLNPQPGTLNFYTIYTFYTAKETINYQLPTINCHSHCLALRRHISAAVVLA